MDYLAQPPPAAPPSDAVPHGDGGSDTSDAGYITSDDVLEEERGGAPHGAGGHGRDAGGGSGGGGGGSSQKQRSFSRAEDDGDGGPSAGQAVAVAALATDYGAWLKRLAVRLRRATPAGERFVRLRCIGPAVTGDQVRRTCIQKYWVGAAFLGGSEILWCLPVRCRSLCVGRSRYGELGISARCSYSWCSWVHNANHAVFYSRRRSRTSSLETRTVGTQGIVLA